MPVQGPPGRLIIGSLGTTRTTACTGQVLALLMLPRSGCVRASRALRVLQLSKFDAHAYIMIAHAPGQGTKLAGALRLAKVDATGAFTAPGSWRAKAAAQLPREWLDFGSIMCLTNTPKLAQGHGPYSVRCPSRPVATLVFSWADGEAGLRVSLLVFTRF